MTARTAQAPRASLAAALLCILALSAWQPASAGTEDAPEIQDPNNDKQTAGAVPTGSVPLLGYAELVSGWIHSENESALEVALKTNAAAPSSLPGGLTLRFEYHLTILGTDRVAYLNVSTAATVGGIATGFRLDGVRVFLTIPQAAIGSPPAGTQITDPFITVALVEGSASLATDRAPNTGGGAAYAMSGGSGTPTTPGDSDNDGLNDTCELQHYDDLNGTNNATADDDADGLTNGQECALGTDPTDPDTDGDGTNDKNDRAPTDPTEGGTGGTQSSSSTSRSSTSSTGTGTSTSGSRTSTSGSDADGEVKSLGDAVEKLKSDAGYLGTSAGGMAAVLILAVLALAVRWSL